jgi:integrase
MQLVLLTGCRSGEIVAGRWRDIDLERGIWTQRNPKNDEPCDVMLSRQAVQLLKYRRGMDETFVFPSPHKKGKHVQQKALGLAQYTARQPGEKRPAEDPIEVAWTVHDLRRTVGTGLAKLGCPRVIQDRVLNHVDNTVSAIYDRYGYDSEARSWLQKWADYLDALTVSKVVPLSTVKAA